MFTPTAPLAQQTNSTTSNDFVLYPNPSNGMVTLNYKLESAQTAELEIYDIYGQLVFNSILDSSDSQLKINNEGLPNGIYVYRIMVNDIEVKSEKIILMR